MRSEGAYGPAAPVLSFLGGAGSVTGSRFLIDAPHARVLVDCGLFQGPKALRLRNREPFPVDPASIDAVVLSHAHVDHTAYLPALARNGFRGRVLATPGTTALSRIVLPDSGRLQEEEAGHANRKGYSKHHPALPLYTEEEALGSLELFEAVPFGRTVDVAHGVSATFRRAGHILGAASVLVDVEGCSVSFSGDLGRPEHPILRPPEPCAQADHLLVESTYGDRDHDDTGALDAFRDAIARTAARGGVVVIPAFAVDRTEVILFHLRRLAADGAIPDLPVYVDSPMAVATLRVYRQAIADRWPEIRDDVGDVDVFDHGRLVEARTVRESKAIDGERARCVIVSASGMATGGRVLHHLAHRLPDPNNTVLLVGFQAVSTRGRLLQDGATALKMLGRYVPVRAEVVHIPAFSVHAGADELVGWLGTCPSPPRTTFVVHGEDSGAQGLRDRIERELGWTAVVPAYRERVSLERTAP